MKRFHFDVDEEFAKKHNEMLRDTRKVTISGISLFVICVVAAVLLWTLTPDNSAWGWFGVIGLVPFGIVMLIVGLMVPRSVGGAQELYDRYPLAPAVIAEVNPRDMVLMALVNTNVDESLTPRYAAALRTVSNIPGIDEPTVGTKVPSLAVGGRRTTRDKDHWQEVTPMPIAWATTDQAILKRARTEIPQEQWHMLDKSLAKLDDVKATPMNLLVL
ncbi:MULTISPECIES: DUF3239 domain-containing protein [unclassified Corynebacterium]|uniref:DUF3239 domain-containing protein n=1 Tax=unclassified Corynebacterium TaxID=2624378 RepID=UPI002653995C|nr:MULTISPECIES: DUF3239 domain-containing protein [unclassified Corynebacterium]MDN8595308.1 DUF3239 domain-containing protein [Corynebacterium sp. P4_F2]WKK56560.1 DUF3239 domain-containing protein [Corynebacterium sp. P4-C1]WKK63996.1 DUF3239 domain-containing protein [Corynebacterium sp. P8-C1]